MKRASLLELLAEVERGRLTPESAMERLAALPFEDLGHSRVDHHRSLRTGLPEVIYAAGKTPAQTVEGFTALVASGVDVLATRVDEAAAKVVMAAHPEATYHAAARVVSLRRDASLLRGHVA